MAGKKSFQQLKKEREEQQKKQREEQEHLSSYIVPEDPFGNQNQNLVLYQESSEETIGRAPMERQHFSSTPRFHDAYASKTTFFVPEFVEALSKLKEQTGKSMTRLNNEAYVLLFKHYGVMDEELLAAAHEFHIDL